LKAPDAILLLVTNPVDVITYIGEDPAWRSPCSAAGDSCVPLSDRQAYAGGAERVSSPASTTSEIRSERRHREYPLPKPSRSRKSHGPDGIFQSVKNAAIRSIAGKAPTNYAIGTARRS
jgi:L-lactate dehydrogenase